MKRQKIGKKDIQGKEIREGDIVQYISRVWNQIGKTKKGTIVYKNFAFRIDMKNYKYNERYYSPNQKNIKIIGSIYK